MERAPWWGGIFERLISYVKRCLTKILTNAKLSYEELLTVVTEVECVLNSRPLTIYIVEEPPTPFHLMIGRKMLSIPDETVVPPKKTSEVSDANSPTCTHPEQRPRRKAAVVGEMKRRQVDQCIASRGGKMFEFTESTPPPPLPPLRRAMCA